MSQSDSTALLRGYREMLGDAIAGLLRIANEVDSLSEAQRAAMEALRDLEVEVPDA